MPAIQAEMEGGTMAYRIALLDDDIKELDRTARMLSFYGERHPQYELEITCFQEIKPFMEAVCRGEEKEGQAFEILLMDIYLPDGDGIESAQVLREKGYGGIIMFKSSSDGDALRAYSVSALHYLLKPASQEQLDGAMDKAVAKIRRCQASVEKEERNVQPIRGAFLSEKEPGGGQKAFRTYTKKILAKMKRIILPQ